MDKNPLVKSQLSLAPAKLPPRPPTPAAPPLDIEYCDMCTVPLKNYSPLLMRRCNICDSLVKDWRTATGWNDLLNLNRDFITGKGLATPYAACPIFDNPHIHPNLLRLHNLGFLVIDAQDEYVKIGKEEAGKHAGKWFELKERAYLTCIIPTNSPVIPKALLDELIYQLFFEMPEIEMVAYCDDQEYVHGGVFEGKYVALSIGVLTQNLENGDCPRHTMFHSTVGPSSAMRTISKYRYATTKEELQWKPWKRCKHNELSVITELDIAKNSVGRRIFGENLPISQAMKPLIITLATRNWPPMNLDLANILFSQAHAIGFQEVFKTDRPGRKSGEQAQGKLKSSSGGQFAGPVADPFGGKGRGETEGQAEEEHLNPFASPFEFPPTFPVHRDLEKAAEFVREFANRGAFEEWRQGRDQTNEIPQNSGPTFGHVGKDVSKATVEANMNAQLAQKLEVLSVLQDVD